MKIPAASYRTVRLLTVVGVLASYRTGEVAGLPGLRRRWYVSIRNGMCAAVLITRSGRPAPGTRPR